jgi:hypothetical protein
MRGQATMEYFLIFSIVIALSLVSISFFIPSIKSSLQGTNTHQGFVEKANKRLGVQDQGAISLLMYCTSRCMSLPSAQRTACIQDCIRD